MTTALIAEDEPLLAEALRRELARAWPGLELLEPAVDGDDAVERALAGRPDIVFLDIRMPGRSGLEAAQAIVEDWPRDAGPLPLLVFVTAYDQYALEAFERAAADYLQKPVQPGRLAACCARLQETLALRAAAAGSAPRPAPGAAATAGTDALLLQRLRELLPSAGGRAPGAPAAPDAPAPLTVLQAGVGATLHMIPVAEVIYFEAADKYVRVVTAQREALIRMPLRELLPRLSAEAFWQIHRGTVVRADAIATATREESGRVVLTLRQRPERLVASRLYAHLFRAM
jgi:DNA-binding LytR/AlgR family response regulator